MLFAVQQHSIKWQTWPKLLLGEVLAFWYGMVVLLGILGHTVRREGEPSFLDAGTGNPSLHLPGAFVGSCAQVCLVGSLQSALVKRTN